MSSESFGTARFRDLLNAPVRNGVYKEKEFHGRGCKIVNMGELFAHPRLGAVSMKRVALTDGELAKSSLQAGDLLFARRSLVAAGAGRCSLVLCVNEATTFESSIIRARPDEALASSEYLYYYFASPAGRTAMGTILRQVAVSGITGSDLMELRVIAPTVQEQRRIATLLRALDDRIALLRETNATLEGIAQALFKSWFVDFDPVRAKQQGLAPAGMDEATAALFPDRFEESALGPLPLGWRTGSILEAADLLSGGTPKTDRPEFWGGDIAWASAKDVSQSSDSILVSTERTITTAGLERSATRLIPRLATIVVARGATTGRMVMLGHEMAMNQTCYGLTSKMGAPVALYCLLSREIDALVTAAHGSVFDTITTSTFARSIVIQPAASVLARFEEVGRPIFERIAESTARSQTLATLRDTLLPRLISGQLRLPEAEQEAPT